MSTFIDYIFGLWLSLFASNLEQVLAGHGLNGPFAQFAVERQKQLNINGATVFELHARHGASEIHITIVPNSSAKFDGYLKQKQFSLRSQFERGASPYPGAVSNAAQCPAEFLPVAEDLTGSGWSGPLTRMAANSRKLFGVCSPRERAFDAANLILLCADRGTLFDLTVFARPNDKETIESLKAVTCAR